MPDDANRPEKEKSQPGLDLSGLNDLSLGPQWGSGNIPAPQKSRGRSRDRDDQPRREADAPGRGQRDRRGDRPPRRREEGRAPRDERSGPRRGGGRERPAAPFKPVLEADFYPDDAPFKALTQAIKTSCRTFELFEIAQLILEKPERWVCVARHPEQKEGEDAILCAAVKDGLPFLDEQAALNHVFAHYLSDFFEIESYEADPPAGTFQLVHRCGITGELLAPPNYHRYQAIVRDHHASRLPHMSFERFQQKIESVRDEEAIQAWLDKMKQRQRYTLKSEFAPEGKEAPVFEQIEDARLHLIANHKDKLVRPAYSARFHGKDVHLLPEGDILRRSIEAQHAHQMRFPLATANNLRGRLRRLNFAVYKKGSKGVSFVCAVKRRFRAPDEVLSENLADLISFIEAHPHLKAKDLPREYLGFSGEDEPGEETLEKPAAAEGAEKGAEAREEAPQPEAEASTPKLSADQEQVLALRRDLRYLVTQGYIIEFSDGRLEAPPVRDASGQVVKKQQEAPQPIQKKEDAGEARSAAEAGPTEADGGSADTTGPESAEGRAPESGESGDAAQSEATGGNEPEERKEPAPEVTRPEEPQPESPAKEPIPEMPTPEPGESASPAEAEPAENEPEKKTSEEASAEDEKKSSS